MRIDGIGIVVYSLIIVALSFFVVNFKHGSAFSSAFSTSLQGYLDASNTGHISLEAGRYPEIPHQIETVPVHYKRFQPHLFDDNSDTKTAMTKTATTLTKLVTKLADLLTTIKSVALLPLYLSFLETNQ